MWLIWNALEMILRKRFWNLIPRKINGLIRRRRLIFRKIVRRALRLKDLSQMWKQIPTAKFAISALQKGLNPDLFLPPEFLADLRWLAKWMLKFQRGKAKMFS